MTGSHLNHFTFTMPMFHKGKLAGFTCCMAHWQDVGGTLGGVTTDIYSEGIQIPILKYQERGMVNEDLVDIIRMNVRLPSAHGRPARADDGREDRRAALPRIARPLRPRCGARRPSRAIMDQSEARARERTRTIPDGIYEAEAFMDDDGVDIGKRVPIKVKVIVKGDEMTIDLTEVSKQVRGFFNSGITTGYACAQVAYKCITSPTDYPINDGAFRWLKVILPPGRVVSAVRPAPMRQWMTIR